MHAVEYGITKIQNSAGDLQNQTMLQYIYGEDVVPMV